ncbi:Co-chaperonin GroES (HSP10) [Hymenobacter psychrotolerans DSM 18569]|uniref:Co-chaperonin GroES n=3 Tax=Hymenobacter TaxID=89966 RepID=A0A1M7F195_9BACT|nr:Co-chaperonin GroES (HSP10) [Hymenobacter psychrotolerans DSM 18569]
MEQADAFSASLPPILSGLAGWHKKCRTADTILFQVNLSTKTYNMSLSIKPLADRVIVAPAAAEEKTKSGIIIPDTAKEKPQRGEVVAVGEGKVADNGTTIKPQVKAGDQVLYGKYAGTEITVDGQDYLIMKESDIFAVL